MAKLGSTRVYGNLILDNALNIGGQIASTVATGTAPLVITSTTAVTNLNADKVDGADLETTLSTGSDVKIPSSKAVATYVTGLGYTTNTGDVTGPASSTSGDIVTFNGVSGKAIQDSGKAFETTLTTSSDIKIPTSKAIATYVTGLGYNSGTITGVTAGTGLSGGGTSGAVSLAVDFTELTTATPTFGSMTLGSAVVSTTNGLAISGAYLNPTTVGNAGNLYIRTTDALAADVGGVLTFGGSYTAAGSETKFAAIAGRKENATDGNYAGYLTFLTRANGSTPSEAMRITSDRRVGIRTQYPSATVEIASAASSGKIVSVLDNDDYPVFNISGTLLENNFIISMGDTGTAQNGTCAKIDDGNEQITLNGSSIILPKFTSAGFVKTNASGLLSVDTASYVPNTDLLRAASTSLISATANSGTVPADVCSISLKANSYYKVSIAGYFYTNLSGTLSQVSLVLPSATGSPSFRGQYTRGLSTAATLTTYPVYTAATSITYTIVDSSRSTNPEFFGIDCIVYSGTADTTLVVRVISTYTGTTRITSAMAGSSITAVKVA